LARTAHAALAGAVITANLGTNSTTSLAEMAAIWPGDNSLYRAADNF